MVTEIKLAVKKEEIENFLRYTFSSKHGPIQICRSSDIGRMIYSMVRSSEFPKVPTFNPEENVVTLVLPNYRMGTDKWKYVHFTREDMSRINDFLQASFNIFFKAFMLAGEDLNFEQKELLEAFMSATNIQDVGKKYETLKKKDYRHRKNTFRILVKSMASIGIETVIK